jgi:hypothetical protein
VRSSLRLCDNPESLCERSGDLCACPATGASVPAFCAAVRRLVRASRNLCERPTTCAEVWHAFLDEVWNRSRAERIEWNVKLRRPPRTRPGTFHLRQQGMLRFRKRAFSITPRERPRIQHRAKRALRISQRPGRPTATDSDNPPRAPFR